MVQRGNRLHGNTGGSSKNAMLVGPADNGVGVGGETPGMAPALKTLPASPFEVDAVLCSNTFSGTGMFCGRGTTAPPELPVLGLDEFSKLPQDLNEFSKILRDVLMDTGTASRSTLAGNANGNYRGALSSGGRGAHNSNPRLGSDLDLNLSNRIGSLVLNMPQTDVAAPPVASSVDNMPSGHQLCNLTPSLHPEQTPATPGGGGSENSSFNASAVLISGLPWLQECNYDQIIQKPRLLNPENAFCNYNTCGLDTKKDKNRAQGVGSSSVAVPHTAISAAIPAVGCTPISGHLDKRARLN
eukprot:363331-Chlamydomonas_euryale.AAC.9